MKRIENKGARDDTGGFQQKLWQSVAPIAGKYLELLDNLETPVWFGRKSITKLLNNTP